MNLPSDQEIQSMTPMMQQYFKLKREVGDAILFFRMGDFYEIFGEDAEEVAPRLQIVLTSRSKGGDQKIPFCGVPHHSAKSYWIKLLKAGYRIGIVDQTEDASKAKGLVKREITKIMTPGCIDDPDGLDDEKPNYLMAVYHEPSADSWSCVITDVSTGELRCDEIAGEDEFFDLVNIFKPAEILARKFCLNSFQSRFSRDLQQTAFSALPESPLKDQGIQQTLLNKVFGVGKLNLDRGAQALLASTLQYLQNLKIELDQFLMVKPIREPESMVLGEIAIRDLELFETAHGRQKKGSLFAEINCTLTPMGARRLHTELLKPQLKLNEIKQRQHCVQYLIENRLVLDQLRTELTSCFDLDRLFTRIAAVRAAPCDLERVRSSLAGALKISKYLAEHEKPKTLVKLTNLGSELQKSQVVLTPLTNSLNSTVGALGSNFDVFQGGYDAKLDKYRELAQNGEQQIRAYEQELRTSTGIASLKIKKHKTFGLLIEVTKTHVARIPSSFIRRQTMVNGERFVTEELHDLSEQLTQAHELACARELELFHALQDLMVTHKHVLRSVAVALATIDLLQAFAYKAIDSSYVCPISKASGDLVLKTSRHPVVETFVGNHNFVGNDVRLTSKSKQMLITGPNMAGKSTLMRQVALLAILHQIGSFVPASQAEMPVFDRIFTRVGASDDLSQGKSTFMVEMSEAAGILREATKKSLIILDEVGRGTSTADGLALATAILEDIVSRLKSYTLFATHYHELVSKVEDLPSVSVMKTDVKSSKEGLVFTHKLVPGAAGQSYGLEVAKLAGLPQAVVERASRHLENAHTSVGVPMSKGKGVPVNPVPLAQFGLQEDIQAASPLIDKVAKIPIHSITPLQALNILNDLKAMVGSRHGGYILAQEEGERV